MAQALAGMPLQRAFVVHGAGGWDEPTPLGPFLLLDVRPGSVARIAPHARPTTACRSARRRSLQGGDAAYNAAALTRVLRGEERGAHRDALLLGAALALEVAGRARAPRDGRRSRPRRPSMMAAPARCWRSWRRSAALAAAAVTP